MSHDTDLLDEARRQAEICNACRYCEGFCAVFPSMQTERAWSDADVIQLANLCHDCRACYYACQFTEPHEFAINLPPLFAELRHKTWRDFTYPKSFATLFQKSGTAIALLSTLAIAAIFLLAQNMQTVGNGFYAYLSHAMMVAIFTPAFIAPLVIIALSVRRYRKAVGDVSGWRDTWRALRAVADMRNLAGGHGKGCNFEDGDRYSNARRLAHQATLYGFLLCFASTCSATVMHYGFGLVAPYDFWTPPKLLGVSGGILLSVGTAELLRLKLRSDKSVAAVSFWSGDVAFILLLFAVSTSGLWLYAASGSAWVPYLLALHLGFVLSFFLLMPYSKMAHGFFRLAALVKDAHRLGKTR